MYEWQTSTDNTQKFSPGQVVRLNPMWSAYTYLQREFGSVFPRFVKRVSIDGVVELEGSRLTFASQCLTAKGLHI